MKRMYVCTEYVCEHKQTCYDGVELMEYLKDKSATLSFMEGAYDTDEITAEIDANELQKLIDNCDDEFVKEQLEYLMNQAKPDKYNRIHFDIF